MNKQQIEKDNNEILECVMNLLDSVALETKEDRKQYYKYHSIGKGGKRVFYKTREEHLDFIISFAAEQLSQYNFFYEKEGIDKYKDFDEETIKEKNLEFISGLLGGKSSGNI